MKKPLFLVTIWLLSGFVFSNCSSSEQWKHEYDGLLQRSAELEHRHSQLQASIDSLWDVTSLQLERSLPAGLPPMDREIFIKARNADHIRMFMSFKQLDPNLQALVNNAGVYDAIIAKEVQTLLEQQQAFEQQKIQFLRKVEKADLTASRTYASELRKTVED